ncbi:N-acetyltransferase [Microbulbifer flavimaris]|uniref:N-acetyltransferase n=1 Tax=Microbulbifer flavimaris TaxID=1781068 RepID=A0ABX4HZM5_9GAMM|nr:MULTISPECIES: GNAT family protein [Microbulbifer]KUJ82837.1 hypothetical protein AVO43_09730 [Microbulbifer sp. ZGT114]PCO05013.1 N-acetyltransferase [Microbulbifer flavimaris]
MNPDDFVGSLPTLASGDYRLRWLSERDLPALRTIFGDPEVVRFMAIACLHTEDDAGAFLLSIQQGFLTGKLYQWGVEYQGLLIGTCTLAQIDRDNRRAEIGFALARRFQGRGLMLQALRLLLDFAFLQMQLHRIEADVDPRNQASLKLLEKLGFLREGVLRDRWLEPDGFQDSVMLALLQRDWHPGNRVQSKVLPGAVG